MNFEIIYPSDLTNEEFDYIRDLIPSAKPGGRPRTLEMREVLNAIFYVTKGGIQWRMLPSNFPNWTSVYNYFRAWKFDGTRIRIHDALRAQVRGRDGRHKHPTAGSLDSQSVKTTEVGTQDTSFDGGKKIKGRGASSSGRYDGVIVDCLSNGGGHLGSGRSAANLEEEARHLQETEESPG